MGTRHSTLRRPDAELLALAKNINKQSAYHASEWELDLARLSELDRLVTNANNAYVENSDLATRNATTSANKNAAFGELKHFLGAYIDSLVGNLKVSESELKIMGLRSRQHPAHQPLKRPDVAPVISVKKQHEEITVYASRPEHDQPSAGVAQSPSYHLMLRYRKSDETEWHTVLSSRLHHTFFFDREEEGQSIILSAAWTNPRFETGPWCEEITIVIG
jgi:hypothetical protein